MPYRSPFIEASWRVVLVDSLGVETIMSDYLEEATLDFSIFRPVRDTGSLRVKIPKDMVLDWRASLVKLYWVMAKPEEIIVPLAVMMPTVSAVEFAGSSATVSVDLHGRCARLDQERYPGALSFPAGTKVEDAIRTILKDIPGTYVESTGVSLSSAWKWDPGETLLRMVNDLASTGGYFAAYTDPNGLIRLDTYVQPSARTPSYTFVDDENGMYTSGWVLEQDDWGTPNRVTVVQKVSGETAPLIAVATDMDSPYGYRALKRWIDAEPIERDGNSVNQLMEAGITRLSQARNKTQTLDFSHGFLPIKEHDTVAFVNNANGVWATYTVAKRSLRSKSNLVNTQLRRAV